MIKEDLQKQIQSLNESIKSLNERLEISDEYNNTLQDKLEIAEAKIQDIEY